MKNVKVPSLIVGLLYIPYGILLAWVAGSGILGLMVQIILAFFLSWLLTAVIHLIYKSSLRKKGLAVEYAAYILTKSSVYLIPFLVIALIARIVLGWGTMMPFIATATMSYVASATMEMTKTGIKGITVTLFPSILASVVTMIWTMLFSILF